MGWKSKRLRDKAAKLSLQGKHREAAEAYAELARVEPDEPRWPHKRGDMLRRLGQDAAAISAYEAAVDAYARMGFLARAVAMAKVVLSIDDTRTDVLARVDPSAAKELRKKMGSGLYDARQLLEKAALADREEDSSRDAIDVPADAPADKHASRKRADSSVFAAAVPLTLQKDDDDLIIFDDAEVTNLTLSDQELADRNERVTTDAEGPNALELATLPAMPLFADIPADALRNLVRGAELVECAAGSVILEQDAAAEALYVLTEGTAQVVSTRMARPVLLTEGEVFGESCLVDGGARQASVVAHTNISALRISKDTLDALCTAHPGLRDVLLELLTRRLVSNLMTTSPIFCDLPKAIQRTLATSFELRTAERGTILVKQNKRADGLYLLLSGTLELVNSGAGTVHELTPGALVGSYSLLRKTGSLHDVTAKSQSIVLRLSATRFRMALIESQSAVDHIQQLAQRTTSDPSRPALST